MANPPFRVLNQTMNSLDSVETMVKNGIATVVECAQDLSETTPFNNDISDQIDEMKGIMYKFLKMKRDLDQYKEAVNYAKDQGQQDESNTQKMLEMVDEQLNLLKVNNKEEDLTQDETYLKLSSFQKPRESEENMEASPGSVEDVAITQEVENIRCAITGKEMIDPLQNKVCGHNYDRQGIEHYLRTRPNGKCPTSGCSSDAPVQKSNLIENHTLKRYIEKRKRIKDVKRQQQSRDTIAI